MTNGVKSYLVQYNIVADVSKANTELQAMMSVAEKASAPLEAVAKSIMSISQAATKLRENSVINISTRVDTEAFKMQLGQLEKYALQTATRIRLAIQEALTGAPASGPILKKLEENNVAATKSSAERIRNLIEKDKKILANNKVDLAQGLLNKETGQRHKLDKKKDATKIADIKEHNRVLAAQIQENEKLLKQVEQEERAAAKQQEKADKKAAASATAAKKAAAAPTANFTPAAVKEMNKLFGKATSKTFTMTLDAVDNTKGVIDSVLINLRKLTEAASFTITPVLNPEAFAAAEKQMAQILGMSKSVGQAFQSNLKSAISKLPQEEQAKYAAAQQKLGEIKEKISPLQARLAKNQAIKNPTPAIKGMITKDTKALETLTAQKAEQEQIVSGIQNKAIASIGTTKGAGAAAKPVVAAEVKGNLILDNKGKTFPVDLVGTIVNLDKLAKTSIPVNVKFTSTQISEALSKVGQKGRTIPINVKFTSTQVNEALGKLNSKGKPVSIKLELDIIGALVKLEEFLAKIPASKNIALTASGAAPSSGGSTGGSATGGVIPPVVPGSKSATGSKSDPLDKVRAWTAKQAGSEKKDELKEARRRTGQRYERMAVEEQKALDNMWNKHIAEQQAKEKAEKRLSRAAWQQKRNALSGQLHNSILPYVNSQEQLNLVAKHRKFFKQAIRVSGITPTNEWTAVDKSHYLGTVANLMSRANVPIPMQLQKELKRLDSQMGKGVSGGRGGGYTGVASKPQSFYDKSRKWAYPFTGPTQFGVRTPMVVDMAKGMGMMFAISGAMSTIGDSFGQAMEYQNTMRTTKAILQNGTKSYTNSGFSEMEHIVRNVGISTKFSAPEVANAAKFLAMAGYDINEINNAIRPIADLALIGDSDLGETADKMTNIMTTFGIKAEEMRGAANVMTTTFTRTNTDLMMLAESAKYGGGVAKMYGVNDPNLFADTMAIFGVMGNAGIQASSAGTALRMMYQNIFKPNKNQKAVLDSLEERGIKTKDENGNNRSMADILIDMANKIPQNEMANIIGGLFRITAQPAANAAIMAATIEQFSKEDGSNAEEVITGLESMADFVEKNGMSKLVELILANRASVSGNISGAIAEEKQNTISGLWAQVTSTFTEGVVKAFEQREGGFADMLKGIRDYLAKPETVRMLQNILDLIVEVAKVLGWVVKAWAGVYSMFPNIIRLWMCAQLAFTQFGMLISPLVALIGVVNRFRGLLISFTGANAVGGASALAVTGRFNPAGMTAYAPVPVSTFSNKAYAAQPYIVASNGRKVVNSRALTHSITSVKAANKLISGQDLLIAKMLHDNSVKDTPENRKMIAGMNSRMRNAMERQRSAEVYKRAKRMYGAKARFNAGFAATNSLMTGISVASLTQGLGRFWVSISSILGKIAGFLLNPVTLLIGSLAALGGAFYYLNKRINGTTDSQLAAAEKMKEAMGKTKGAIIEHFKWFDDLFPKPDFTSVGTTSLTDPKKIQEYNEQQEKAREMYATAFSKLNKDLSIPAINENVGEFRELFNSHVQNRLALGSKYDDLITNLDNFAEVDVKAKHNDPTYFGPMAAASQLAAEVHDVPKARAAYVAQKQLDAILMTEGASSAEAQEAVKKVIDLKKTLSPEEFQKEVQKIRAPYDNLESKGLLSTEGKTAEELAGALNRNQYLAYQEGIRNIIDAHINGEVGTYTGYLDALSWLQNTENQVSQYETTWWSNISKVLVGHKIFWNNIVGNDGIAKSIEVSLRSLPDGKIDFSYLVKQVQDVVEGFQDTIQGFSEAAAAVYQTLIKLGILTDSEGGMQKFIYENTQHQYVSQKAAEDYFINNLADSEWAKAGFNAASYADFVTSHQEAGDKLQKFTTINGKKIFAAQERVRIRRNSAKQAAEAVQGNANGLTGSTGQGTDGNNGNTNTNGNGNTTNTVTTPDQTPYGATAYERSAAKPTQIVFNIGNLAQFDRTVVSSSAEERDLMAAMESRITDAVYTLFAEAARNANSVTNIA